MAPPPGTKGKGGKAKTKSVRQLLEPPPVPAATATTSTTPTGSGIRRPSSQSVASSGTCESPATAASVLVSVAASVAASVDSDAPATTTTSPPNQVPINFDDQEDDDDPEHAHLSGKRLKKLTSWVWQYFTKKKEYVEVEGKLVEELWGHCNFSRCDKKYRAEGTNGTTSFKHHLRSKHSIVKGQQQLISTRSLPVPKMGHSDGEHEHDGDDLTADDSSWSDGVWSEDDQDSSEVSGSSSDSDSDGESDEAAAAEESDSSEDEVAPRNTVGDVPLEWYKDEEHIGYDIDGRKIKKRDRERRIEAYLRNADDAKNWRKIYDEYNDEEVLITKDEAKIISRLLKGKTPHTNVDPYPDYVDWFEYEDKGHPLSSAPEPKRRFVPSKWEQKKVVKLVRAIRNGWIKFDKPKEECNLYLLWGDETDTADNKRHGLSYIPPPKPKLPGHEESYNPSIEYVPTQEEIDSYQLMYEEDRPKFIPKRFESLRSVPAYEKALKEGFDRCLDLYLCPRTRKKHINIDPESLKPKLPSKKDLRPYPKTCYLEFKGHTSPVKSISVEISGQWLASGSCDGTIRVWEVETGRCLKVWNVGGDVRHIAWNPSPDRPILAAVVGHDLLLINAEVGSEEIQMRVKDLLKIDEMAPQDDTDDKKPAVRWMQHEKLDGITLIHQKAVSNVEWHYKGDYFTTVVPTGDTRAVLLHQLTKKHSHHPFRKLPGLPVAATFHPSQKMFFVATKKFVQVYDLQKAQLIKKLESGLREISSISIHPGGDNVIVGSKDGKLCWFDTDLSTRPYKTLKIHSKDITSVTFHRKYPLLASSSEDCTAYVCHGMVYSDLNQNPLIVPLEILRGHSSSDGRGVLDCKFHPKQPWLFTAGADSVIRLYCD